MQTLVWSAVLAVCAFPVSASAEASDESRPVGAGAPLRPTLCLTPEQIISEVADDCFNASEDIIINVEMGESEVAISGAQLILSYDMATLDFLSIEPAGGTFGQEIFESVDTVNGFIDYAVGDPTDDPVGATFGPARIAVIRFNARGGSCRSGGVDFRLGSDPPTRLVEPDGTAHLPLCHGVGDGCPQCDSGLLRINRNAPIIADCQPFGGPAGPDVRVGAPCDGTGLNHTLTWTPITATATCETQVALTCTAVHHAPCTSQADCPIGTLCGTTAAGFCDQGSALPDPHAGGDFPPGRTVIACEARNRCGRRSTCGFEVLNTGMNTLLVEVELGDEDTFSPVPFDRCLHMNIESHDEKTGIISRDITVTVRDGSIRTVLDLPPSDWACLTTRDSLHTLPATCVIECVDELVLDADDGVILRKVYAARLVNDPQTAFTCPRLTSGNLNDDLVIDIIDFVVLLGQMGTTPGVATSCESLDPANPNRHADFDGNGAVDLADFSFIFVNFLEVAPRAGCTPTSAGAVDDNTPRLSITIEELEWMGLADAAYVADVNTDGVVDMNDIAEFLEASSATPARSAKPTRSRNTKRSRDRR